MISKKWYRTKVGAYRTGELKVNGNLEEFTRILCISDITIVTARRNLGSSESGSAVFMYTINQTTGLLTQTSPATVLQLVFVELFKQFPAEEYLAKKINCVVGLPAGRSRKHLAYSYMHTAA